MSKKIIHSAVLLALGLANHANAGSFVNGGFEDNSFNGWTQGSGSWNGGWPIDPATYQPGAAGYDAGAQASAVVGAGDDPVLAAEGVSIKQVFSGNYSARVNDSNNNNSVNTIQQTVTNYTDPKIFFAWSAVLQGSHGTTDSDNFTLTLRDDTTSTELYNVSYSSANTPEGFQSINGIFYSDWQVQQLDVSTLSGHTFTLSLLAADCPYGGHWGYVYLDGFGAVIPTGGTIDLINGDLDLPDKDHHSTSSAAFLQPTLIFDGGTLFFSPAITTTNKDAIINPLGGTVNSNGTESSMNGILSGVGTFTKTGVGALSLNAANTYTGPTNVNQGILSINGSLVSSVTVDAGGTLRGIGLLLAPTTVNGTLAPGNSPGMLTSNAAVTMNPGSVYLEDIDGLGIANGAGNYSRLLLNGPGNPFTANGLLQPLLRGITGNANNNFTPILGDTFKIVTAEGGIAGRFSAVNHKPDGLTPGTQLDPFYNIYGSNSIELVTTPSPYREWLAGVGANANAQSVGGVLDTLRNADDVAPIRTDYNELRYEVAKLRAAAIPGVTTELAGEVHAAIAAAAPETGRWLQTALARQLATTPGGQDAPELKMGDNLWVDFNAGESQTDGGSSASGFSASRYQFAIGADVLRNQANRLGLGVTYSTANVAPASGSGRIEETAPFLYGQYAVGKTQKAIIDTFFAYGFSTWHTDRADPLRLANPVRYTSNLSTDASGNSATLGFGVRSPWIFRSFSIEPFVRVIWQNSSRAAVNEGLLTPSALTLSSYGLSGTRLLAGATIGPENPDPLANPFSYRASLAFGEDFGELVYPSVQASLAGVSYQIRSPRVGREFGQLNLSGTYHILENAYVYVGLNGEARSSRLDGGVNAGFNFKF